MENVTLILVLLRPPLYPYPFAFSPTPRRPDSWSLQGRSDFPCPILPLCPKIGFVPMPHQPSIVLTLFPSFALGPCSHSPSPIPPTTLFLFFHSTLLQDPSLIPSSSLPFRSSNKALPSLPFSLPCPNQHLPALVEATPFFCSLPELDKSVLTVCFLSSRTQPMCAHVATPVLQSRW